MSASIGIYGKCAIVANIIEEPPIDHYQNNENFSHPDLVLLVAHQIKLSGNGCLKLKVIIDDTFLTLANFEMANQG